MENWGETDIFTLLGPPIHKYDVSLPSSQLLLIFFNEILYFLPHPFSVSFSLWNNFRFTENSKNNTKDLGLPLTWLPLMLTSYIHLLLDLFMSNLYIMLLL